jgi:hypothetical protein
VTSESDYSFPVPPHKQILKLCALSAALLFLITPAKAVSISGSLSAGFAQAIQCQQTDQLLSSPVQISFVIDEPASCVGSFGPPVHATAFYSAFGGSASLAVGCEFSGAAAPPLNFVTAFCSASVSVEGDYYFGGNGIQSFNLGFFSAGISSPGPFIQLTIDGQPIPLPQSGGGPAVVQNLQLGEFHHITLSASGTGSSNQGFSYDLDTPGILGQDIVPPPIPEPAGIWLGAGGLLLFTLRRELRSGRKI